VSRVAADAKKAGARVVTRLPALDWTDLGAILTDLVETLTGVFAPGADKDDQRRTLAWYIEALGRRDRFVSVWERYFDDLDALIVPATMTTTFGHCEQGGEVAVDGTPVSYYENSRLLGPSNLVGAPTLTVPAGLDDDGLPIGLQIIGPRWSEMRLLDVARALEDAKVLPGLQRPPVDRGSVRPDETVARSTPGRGVRPLRVGARARVRTPRRDRVRIPSCERR